MALNNINYENVFDKHTSLIIQLWAQVALVHKGRESRYGISLW